uniref:Uncharacterized protein n=1 Tax=Solanum lycopersicum TaxID=4081 RepID=A0A3Q7F9C2_SOLLC
MEGLDITMCKSPRPQSLSYSILLMFRSQFAPTKSHGFLDSGTKWMDFHPEITKALSRRYRRNLELKNDATYAGAEYATVYVEDVQEFVFTFFKKMPEANHLTLHFLLKDHLKLYFLLKDLQFHEMLWDKEMVDCIHYSTVSPYLDTVLCTPSLNLTQFPPGYGIAAFPSDPLGYPDIGIRTCYVIRLMTMEANALQVLLVFSQSKHIDLLTLLLNLYIVLIDLFVSIYNLQASDGLAFSEIVFAKNFPCASHEDDMLCTRASPSLMPLLSNGSFSISTSTYLGKYLLPNMPRKQDSLPGHMSRHAIAVIEFARSILGLQDANCTEFDTNTHNPCAFDDNESSDFALSSQGSSEVVLFFFEGSAVSRDGLVVMGKGNGGAHIIFYDD